jgi:hypothetical protein
VQFIALGVVCVSYKPKAEQQDEYARVNTSEEMIDEGGSKRSGRLYSICLAWSYYCFVIQSNIVKSSPKGLLKACKIYAMQ